MVLIFIGHEINNAVKNCIDYVKKNVK